ncbi:DUF7674 family protein [Spirosoma foliorum]|uniref:DUF7674 domain-containing protein n=1 Tax=Spirosoma foliorum TaxID=2710596 RepID=A0A7G5GN88_9BACT|nr:hypothetical protein [Spirosoma foliorum]QMW00330.1 hypothetical protein H3H32_20150 [Spirosoma foliorum]
MKNEISRNELLNILANRIPEARREFMRMPDQLSVAAILNKLFDITASLISQHKFRVVKRCLLVAEDLLKEGDHDIRTSLKTVYMYRLATLLYKRDAQSEFVHFLLPIGLRTEFHRNTYPDE